MLRAQLVFTLEPRAANGIHFVHLLLCIACNRCALAISTLPRVFQPTKKRLFARYWRQFCERERRPLAAVWLRQIEDFLKTSL